MATEQVTGKADAIAILNDVIGLLDQFGTGQDGVERLEGDAADRVRKAVVGGRGRGRHRQGRPAAAAGQRLASTWPWPIPRSARRWATWPAPAWPCRSR